MTPSEQKLKRVEAEYREFVQALSHDLAGPFRHVIGFSDMIMRAGETSFDEKTTQQLNFIRTAGNNGKIMLDQLKAYARLTDDAEPAISNNTSQMIESILEELNGLVLENNTQIDIGTLPEVTASPDLLRIAFFHIIKNAIMYSKNVPSPTIKIAGFLTPTHVKYEVIDNGIGMTDYQTEKVLLVLKRAVAPADYPGNGMGLAIVKKTIQYHNGKVEIESSPETGTKVSVLLPVIGS